MPDPTPLQIATNKNPMPDPLVTTRQTKARAILHLFAFLIVVVLPPPCQGSICIGTRRINTIPMRHSRCVLKISRIRSMPWAHSLKLDRLPHPTQSSCTTIFALSR